MHRSTVLGITATALLSIAASLLGASLFLQPAPAVIASDARTTTSERAVRQFYAAANEAIATGNISALETVVAPDFVERNSLPGVGAGREGLEEYLLALHEALPATELVAEPVIAAGDQVMARVAIRAGQGQEQEQEQATMDGTLVGQSVPWGHVDVFRLTDGKIVERWSQTDGLTLVRPLAALQRVSVASGAVWSWVVDGPLIPFLDGDQPLILVVEGGSVRVDVTPPAATIRELESDEQGSPVTDLSTGGSLVLAPGSQVRVKNPGLESANLLIASVSVPRIPGGEAPDVPDLPAGVIAQVLAEGLPTGLVSSPAALELSQVTLAPRGRLVVPSREGPALIALDSGELEVGARGQAWLRKGLETWPVGMGPVTMAPGDGMLVATGGQVTIENATGNPAVGFILMLR